MNIHLLDEVLERLSDEMLSGVKMVQIQKVSLVKVAVIHRVGLLWDMKMLIFISRTPQKETANGIARYNSRSLKRNPQTLSKKQQKEAFANATKNKQQSHLDRLRKDGINSPMLKDALNEGNEELSKRAPILQDKKDESTRTDS